MMMQTKKPAANPLMEIAERIREMREIVGYSEAEMAEKTEVSVEQYHSYEQGTVLPHVLGRVGKITAEKWQV